jgi:hypothetical protein
MALLSLKNAQTMDSYKSRASYQTAIAKIIKEIKNKKGSDNLDHETKAPITHVRFFSGLQTIKNASVQAYLREKVIEHNQKFE